MFKNKANEIINNYILSSLECIDVKAGLCRYNYECHRNAVNDAVNNNEDSLAMCFYIDDDDNSPIIHFVNITNDGGYIDNTLGYWSSRYNYYLIRKINKNMFDKVLDIFMSYRKELNLKLPLYMRYFIPNNSF
jgi:hypothetical protein